MRPHCGSRQGAQTSSQMVVKETWKKNKGQNVGEIQPAKEGMLMVRKALQKGDRREGKLCFLRIQIYIAAQLCPEKLLDQESRFWEGKYSISLND